MQKKYKKYVFRKKKKKKKNFRASQNIHRLRDYSEWKLSTLSPTWHFEEKKGEEKSVRLKST